MTDNSIYIPATDQRRFLAFVANAFLITVSSMAIDYAGIYHRKGALIYVLVFVLNLAFCYFPESPGKRLLGLKILDEQKRAITPSIRLVRSLPFLIFFGFIPIIHIQAETMVGHTLRAMSGFALLFVFSDGLAIILSPESRSLFDMRLGTRVMTTPRAPDYLRPRILGLKIW